MLKTPLRHHFERDLAILLLKKIMPLPNLTILNRLLIKNLLPLQIELKMRL